jgi:hypothetical protein
MGGTSRPEVNEPANLILLCGSGTTGCHGAVEANRTLAVENGLLLPAGAVPEEVPVRLFKDGRMRLVLLDNDGDWSEVA